MVVAALRGRFLPREDKSEEASDFVREREVEKDVEVTSVLIARGFFPVSFKM